MKPGRISKAEEKAFEERLIAKCKEIAKAVEDYSEETRVFIREEEPMQVPTKMGSYTWMRRCPCIH